MPSHGGKWKYILALSVSIPVLLDMFIIKAFAKEVEHLESITHQRVSYRYENNIVSHMNTSFIPGRDAKVGVIYLRHSI